MSKKIQIMLIVGLIGALSLSSWTIFFGKGSILTTSMNRKPNKTIITKNTVNILHSSYKGLQGTQWSPSRSDQLEKIINDRVQ